MQHDERRALSAFDVVQANAVGLDKAPERWIPLFRLASPSPRLGRHQGERHEKDGRGGRSHRRHRMMNLRVSAVEHQGDDTEHHLARETVRPAFARRRMQRFLERVERTGADGAVDDAHGAERERPEPRLRRVIRARRVRNRPRQQLGGGTCGYRVGTPTRSQGIPKTGFNRRGAKSVRAS